MWVVPTNEGTAVIGIAVPCNAIRVNDLDGLIKRNEPELRRTNSSLGKTCASRELGYVTVKFHFKEAFSQVGVAPLDHVESAMMFKQFTANVVNGDRIKSQANIKEDPQTVLFSKEELLDIVDCVRDRQAG